MDAFRPDFLTNITNKLKNDLDQLTRLEQRASNPMFGGIYSDSFIKDFYTDYEHILNRFNSYMISYSKQPLERLHKLKTQMDNVVKYKEQFLAEYKEVKIMVSATTDTYLEDGLEKQYNNDDIYYEIVMNENIVANELGKIINVTSGKQQDIHIHNSYTDNSDGKVDTLDIVFTSDNVKDNVKKYINFPVSLYKKIALGGRRKLKSSRRKISGKKCRRKTLNKKRRGKK